MLTYTDASNRRVVLRDGAFGTFVLELFAPQLSRPARVAVSGPNATKLATLLATEGTAGRLETTGDLPPVRVVHGHEGIRRGFRYVRLTVVRRGVLSTSMHTYQVVLPLDVAREWAVALSAGVV